eukprot:s246_g11.t1
MALCMARVLRLLADGDFVGHQKATLMADLLIVAGEANVCGPFKFKIMDLGNHIRQAFSLVVCFFLTGPELTCGDPMLPGNLRSYANKQGSDHSRMMLHFCRGSRQDQFISWPSCCHLFMPLVQFLTWRVCQSGGRSMLQCKRVCGEVMGYVRCQLGA